MQRNGVLRAESDDVGHRRDRADLVVGPHHRHKCDLLGSRRQLPLQLLDPESSEGVDREPTHIGLLGGAEPLDGIEHGVMLDRRGQHPGATPVSVAAGPVETLHCEVVGLGATGGEDNLTC